MLDNFKYYSSENDVERKLKLIVTVIMKNRDSYGQVNTQFDLVRYQGQKIYSRGKIITLWFFPL